MDENVRDIANDFALIASEAADLMAKMNDDDSDVSIEAFKDTMESLELMIKEKGDVVVAVNEKILNEIKGVKDHIEYYQNLKRSWENRQRYFHDRISYAMDQAGITKVFTEHKHSIYISPNGGAQPIEINEDEIGEEYYKLEKILDRKKIREDLEAGKEVKGAKLLPRGRHLAIK